MTLDKGDPPEKLGFLSDRLQRLDSGMQEQIDME
jgi:hypothetical protein